jgi:hypothetical protein
VRRLSFDLHFQFAEFLGGDDDLLFRRGRLGSFCFSRLAECIRKLVRACHIEVAAAGNVCDALELLARYRIDAEADGVHDKLGDGESENQ